MVFFPIGMQEESHRAIPWGETATPALPPAPRLVPLAPPDAVHDAHAPHCRRAAGPGPAGHPARGVRQLRRSPEPVARRARPGGSALLVAAAPGPAGDALAPLPSEPR